MPEEWKRSEKPRPWHQAQLGMYFHLIEDPLGVRPLYGVIVCGDGTRHRVENTEKRYTWVLAAQIRAARAQVDRPIQVDPKPWRR